MLTIYWHEDDENNQIDIYRTQSFDLVNISFVLVPPSRLRISPSPQLPVADGTTVVFNCTSERAYPIPVFQWFKNKQLIQQLVQFDYYSHVLFISWLPFFL